MTKFCESCHTPNRDHARYCRGCTGRFSGIVTGASAVGGAASPPAPGKPAEPVPAPAPTAAAAVAEGGSGALRWALALALLLCAFVLWHWGEPKANGDAPWRRTTVLPSPPAAAPYKAAAARSNAPAPVAAASHIDVVQRALALKPATLTGAAPAVDPQAEDYLVQDIPPAPDARQGAAAVQRKPASRTARAVPPRARTAYTAPASLAAAAPPPPAPAPPALPLPARGASPCAADDAYGQALCVPSSSSAIRAGR